MPWRADTLQAAVYTPTDPYPTLLVVIVCAVVVAVLIVAGVRLISGRKCPDCTQPCPVCDAAWRRERGRL